MPIPAKFISGLSANWLYNVPSIVAEPIPNPIPKGFFGASGESAFASVFDSLSTSPLSFSILSGISFSIVLRSSLISRASFFSSKSSVSSLSDGFLFSSKFCSSSGSFGYSFGPAGACIKLPDEPLKAFCPGPTLTV